MINPTATDLAYIAGIIDGEGCIMITERGRPSTRRCQTPSFIVSVVVAMTDSESIQFMAARFKGRTYQRSRRDGRRDYYTFSTSCRTEVAPLLTSILPYLKVKWRQASLAIDFCHRKKFKGGFGNIVPDTEIDVRRFYVAEMHHLNQKEI